MVHIKWCGMMWIGPFPAGLSLQALAVDWLLLLFGKGTRAKAKQAQKTQVADGRQAGKRSQEKRRTKFTKGNSLRDKAAATNLGRPKINRPTEK